MTSRELSEAVANIRYRPNWTLQVEYHIKMMAIEFRVVMHVEDARSPGNMIDVALVEAIPYEEISSWDEGHFIEFIHHLLLRAETHECDEFFTYKGTRPFDPHSTKGLR